MARRIPLRLLKSSEQRVLRFKLRDLSLSVRVHQRYRIIDQVRCVLPDVRSRAL
jgi:hypothetical protein